METSGNSGTSLLSTEKKSAIDNCSDFKEFFNIMHQYISWDAYFILSEIIDECKSVEAEEEFDKYKKKMAVSKALEIISSTKSDPPPGFDKFIVIIDKPYSKLTVGKYEEFKKFIFVNLDVHRYVANEYIRVLFNSLHLEWHVTTQAIPHMIEMAYKQRAVFIRNYYVFMKIGKEIIIDDMYTEQTLVSLHVVTTWFMKVKRSRDSLPFVVIVVWIVATFILCMCSCTLQSMHKNMCLS